MANIVIKGVYASKSALDSAELADASNGDTYIVGSKIPYELYTYSSSKTAFQKGDKVSNVASELSTPVSIEDVTADIPVSTLCGGITFKDGSKSYKVRKAIGKSRIESLELYGVSA